MKTMLFYGYIIVLMINEKNKGLTGVFHKKNRVKKAVI